MPNWCYNRITVYAEENTADKLEELKEIFETKQPFNTLFPIPDFKNIPNSKGELPKLEQHKNPDGSIMWETYNFPDGKNDDRWYHWCIDNWGTKWDINLVGAEVDESYAEFEFQTAWGPASGIFDKIKEDYPDVGISWFYDEPGMEIAGYLPN